MTNHIKDIEALIEAGEKIVQGEYIPQGPCLVSVPFGLVILCLNENGKPLPTEKLDTHLKFFAQAANSRDAISAMLEENKELKQKLAIANYAFDSCHRYNGNSRGEYFKEAKRALKSKEMRDEER